MSTNVTSEVHRSLVERVTRRLAGRGITPALIEDAVTRVVAGLGARAHGGRSVDASPTILAALAARSSPDLASRLRRDLGRDGIVIEEMGLGTAGQHTVVTLRVSSDARTALERVAERARCSLTFFDLADGGASPT
ncbi:MAG: hypothetical protein ACR2OG_16560 [Gemmatimonadaceae bacterium]